MVDFDNEATVATPSKDVMRIYLLQCKAYMEDMWRIFRQHDFAGSGGKLDDVRAYVEQTYLVMEAMINRQWKDERYGIGKEGIINTIENGKKEDIRKLIIALNRLLDDMKITRLDTKIVTGKTLEADNIAHGF